jgi:hypothetical protein
VIGGVLELHTFVIGAIKSSLNQSLLHLKSAFAEYDVGYD